MAETDLIDKCADAVLSDISSQHPFERFFAKESNGSYSWGKTIYRERKHLGRFLPQKIARVGYAGWECGYSTGHEVYDEKFISKEELKTIVGPILKEFFSKVQFPQMMI